MNSPTDNDLERIADALWNGHGEGIVITDKYEHNACNHTLTGNITTERGTFGFVIQMGDWNGTDVIFWGDSEDNPGYKHVESEPLTFVPTDPLLHVTNPFLFKAYLWRRKTKEFKEKVAQYLYDRHFQPGSLVENHYREWAKKMGMTVGLFSQINGVPEDYNEN